MLGNCFGSEIASNVRAQLGTAWTVSSQSPYLSAESDDLLAYMRIEPQRDGSFIVTGYVETEWEGSDETPVLDFYSRSTNQETAVDKYIEFGQSREELGEALWTDEANVVSLETVAQAIKETDAVFAAISEDHLARGLFGLIYHVPIAGDDESVADGLREFEGVEINGHPFPIRLSSVLASGTHLYRRVPMYAEETLYGPEELAVEDGVQKVREFVRNDENPTPLLSETVTGDCLVEELIDIDAVAIAVEPELSNETMLTLTVWIPDATAYEVVGQYERVSVEGTKLDLNCEFRCVGGPNFFHRIPVYADDDIIGMEPVPIDEGLSNLKEYIDYGWPQAFESRQGGGEDGK